MVYFMKLKSLLSIIFASCIICAGCAYRIDIPQGNFTEQKDVFKLHKGMTKEQVKFVLGTPMLLDPLDHTKWYYINYIRTGWNEPEEKKLEVTFDANNLLLDIQGDFQKNPSFDTPL